MELVHLGGQLVCVQNILEIEDSAQTKTVMEGYYQDKSVVFKSTKRLLYWQLKRDLRIAPFQIAVFFINCLL